MTAERLSEIIIAAGYKISKVVIKDDDNVKHVVLSYYIREDELVRSVARIIETANPNVFESLSGHERLAVIDAFKTARWLPQPRNRQVVYFPEMEIEA